MQQRLIQLLGPQGKLLGAGVERGLQRRLLVLGRLQRQHQLRDPGFVVVDRVGQLAVALTQRGAQALDCLFEGQHGGLHVIDPRLQVVADVGQHLNFSQLGFDGEFVDGDGLVGGDEVAADLGVARAQLRHLDLIVDQLLLGFRQAAAGIDQRPEQDVQL